MNTKTKLSIGITFLFVLIICMGGASIYFIKVLAIDSGEIIKDNQISIDYVQHMDAEIDSIHAALHQSINKVNIQTDLFKTLFSKFNKNLDSESNNITEVGEKAAVNS